MAQHGRGTAWYVWIKIGRLWRPVGDLRRFGFFRPICGIPRLTVRIFPSTHGLSRMTRRCRRTAEAQNGMCELFATRQGRDTASYVRINLHTSTMKMEADYSTETVGNFHNNTWYHMSEGNGLHIHRWENLKIWSLHDDYKRDKHEWCIWWWSAGACHRRGRALEVLLIGNNMKKSRGNNHLWALSKTTKIFTNNMTSGAAFESVIWSAVIPQICH